MHNKGQYQEEEILGSIHLEKIKCGKANCRCVSGRKHKAYYHYYREKNKYGDLVLVKKYIKKEKVKKLKAKIQYCKNKRSAMKLFTKGISGNNLFLLLSYAKVEYSDNINLSYLYKNLHILIKKAKFNIPTIIRDHGGVGDYPPFQISKITRLNYYEMIYEQKYIMRLNRYQELSNKLNSLL